tara:strand:- start:19031 stop:20950 length:1920 start_codon:yes stop_codon:yes gene_type:complete
MKKLVKNYRSLFFTISIGLVLIFINSFLSNYFFRFDLSKDQIHSLSEHTKKTLSDLEEIINVEVYLDGDFPAEIEKLKKALSEKLDEFKAYGEDNFKVDFRNLDEDPVASKEVKNQVYNDGIDYCDILIKRDSKQEVIRIWPGVILRMGDQNVPVQLLQGGKFPISQLIINQFNDQLEYNLMLGVNNLLNPTTKKIRFLRGHGELDNADAWVIRDKLIKFYDVDTLRIKQLKTSDYNKTLDISDEKYDSLVNSKSDSIIIGKNILPVFDQNRNPNKNTQRYIKKFFQNKILKKYNNDPTKNNERLDALDGTDLLIVAKPVNPFTEKELFVIDQYVMNGGKIIWLIDMLDVEESILKDSSFTFAKPVNHGLQQFLFKYGARFNVNMINDFRCSPLVREDGLGKIQKWFFYPLLYNDNSMYLKNVGPIKGRYVCSIDTVGENKLLKIPLLTSSDQYKILRQTTVNYQNLKNYNPTNFEINQNKTKPTVGWLFKGVFNSNFENRLVSKSFKKFINSPKTKFKSLSTETKMAFIGDGDLIRNDFIKVNNDIKPVLLSFESADYGNPSFFSRYGNSIFFLNLIDELLGREELIPLRSKMNMPRLLNKEVFLNKKFWQFINIIVPLIIIIFLGILNHYIRKKKYV